MSFEHHARVITPLGEEALKLKALSGDDALGQPFRVSVELLSEDNALDFGQLVGEPITVELEVVGQAPREITGHVVSLSLAGGSGRYVLYRAEIRPWFFLLTYSSNSRIFQFMTVPDVVKQVFRDRGFSDFEEKLTESYRSWDYLVQYRESDFNFVTRLLEQEGIYYFFKHEGGRAILVLADSPSAHVPRPGYETVPYFPPDSGGGRDREHLDHFQVTRRLGTTSAVVRDFDFKRPTADLTSKRGSAEPQAGAEMEVFDYPGEFVSSGEGDTVARVTQERLEQVREGVHARGNPRALSVGDRFTLEGFPRTDQNRAYLVTASRFSLRLGDYETSGQAAPESAFSTDLALSDAERAFRPAVSAHKPTVEGPQTAIVVGVAGEEIFTDEFGRIKVQFHWDREGSSDENSSCWVRVAQLWAGSGFGGIHIPRIGQEVIVDFLEGDPDRPIVTGRVYNAHNMPPYELPANQTQSGIKSRSTKGGQVPNFNELRFEDLKGSEQVYLQAEKNLDALVKDSETREVGVNRSTDIGVDDTLTVGQNHTETVGANQIVTVAVAQTITVGAARSLSVGAGESITVGASRSDTVGGSESISIGRDQVVTVAGRRNHSVDQDDSLAVAGKRTVQVQQDSQVTVGKRLIIDAADEIVLKCGKATLVLKKSGDIQLNGKDLNVSGSGKIDVKASSDLVMKGRKISQN